jgi:hypothetical protein
MRNASPYSANATATPMSTTSGRRVGTAERHHPSSEPDELHAGLAVGIETATVHQCRNGVGHGSRSNG